MRNNSPDVSNTCDGTGAKGRKNSTVFPQTAEKKFFPTVFLKRQKKVFLPFTSAPSYIPATLTAFQIVVGRTLNYTSDMDVIAVRILK